MSHHRRSFVFALFIVLTAALVPAWGEDKAKSEKGLRVFTCGHSFHVFVPGILADLAKKGELTDHKQVGLSSIGGSRVIQHWEANSAQVNWDKGEYVVNLTIDTKTKLAIARVSGKAAKSIKTESMQLTLGKTQIELKVRKQHDADKGPLTFAGASEELAKDIALKGTLSAEFGDKKYISEVEITNQAKTVLTKGAADVLTLSPIYPPDDGIDKFVALALKHNKDVRVTLQANWLPFDSYEPTFSKRPKEVDHDAPTIADLKKMHEPYFESLDKTVRDLNKTAGKDVIFVVPVGQAVLALREKIVAGKAPGLTKQSDLFTDAIGHARPPLAVLNAYCHYSVIYKKSPVGLAAPQALGKSYDEKLNRLLQELAWEAVTNHPLTGVKAQKK